MKHAQTKEPHMRSKNWKALALVALVVAALGAVGCGGSDNTSGTGAVSASAQPKKIFTFVFGPRGFNDVTRAWFNGFDAAAAKLRDRFTIEQKATGKLETDAAAYLSFIRSSLAQQPDGIVVVPNNAAAMAAGLKQIAKDGTKVLIMDQDVPDMPGKVAFVGTDNAAAGKVAADWMIQQAKDGELRSNEIGVLASAPGISSTDDRLRGFLDGLKGSNLKVVAKLAPQCNDSADSRSAMADMLSAHPNLGGVFSVCDVIALGAARAIQAQAKGAVKQISIDASKQGVDRILAHGGIDAEVAQHLLAAGEQSVETLGKALDGEPVPKVVDTGTDLVTEENAKSYLAKASAESK
jgi:ABC-type sugar transport system substrate-binding protein